MKCRVLVSIALLCVAFATASWSQDGEATSFSFAVLGDSRPGGKAPYAPVLERLCADISQTGVDVVLGTGDYIDGSSNQGVVRAQYANFFQGLAPLQAARPTPVAFAPGNHEILGIPANERIFEEYFGHLYFSFDMGGCHFIVLNTDGAHTSGMIDDRQLQWLRADLAARADALFTFVVLHQPLYPVDGHVGSSLDAHPQRRDALHALFVKEGVDCVFAGHEHLYNHQLKDGVHYFITGGAGAPLYASPDRGGFHHYLRVHIEGDRYEVTVRQIASQ